MDQNQLDQHERFSPSRILMEYRINMHKHDKSLRQELKITNYDGLYCNNITSDFEHEIIVKKSRQGSS